MLQLAHYKHARGWHIY